MKKLFLVSFLSILFTFSSYSQTSNWGVSITYEFTKYKVEYEGNPGGDIADDSNVTNLNVHYSILSWDNDFQIGPLVSMRFYNSEFYDGDVEMSGSDLQLGLNLGYNFSTSFAIVMDTYTVFDDVDDRSVFVFKPALEIHSKKSNLAGLLGYSSYSYSGDLIGKYARYKAGGLFFGLKYKF